MFRDLLSLHLALQIGSVIAGASARLLGALRLGIFAAVQTNESLCQTKGYECMVTAGVHQLLSSLPSE